MNEAWNIYWIDMITNSGLSITLSVFAFCGILFGALTCFLKGIGGSKDLDSKPWWPFITLLTCGLLALLLATAIPTKETAYKMMHEIEGSEK